MLVSFHAVYKKVGKTSVDNPAFPPPRQCCLLMLNSETWQMRVSRYTTHTYPCFRAVYMTPIPITCGVNIFLNRWEKQNMKCTQEERTQNDPQSILGVKKRYVKTSLLNRHPLLGGKKADDKHDKDTNYRVTDEKEYVYSRTPS